MAGPTVGAGETSPVSPPTESHGNLLQNIGRDFPEDVDAPVFTVPKPATPEPLPISKADIIPGPDEVLPPVNKLGNLLGDITRNPEPSFSTRPLNVPVPQAEAQHSPSEDLGQEKNQRFGRLRSLFGRTRNKTVNPPAEAPIPAPVLTEEPLVAPTGMDRWRFPVEPDETLISPPPAEVPPVPPIDPSIRAREIDEMIAKATEGKPAVDVKIPDWMRKREPSVAPATPKPPVVQASTSTTRESVVLPPAEGAFSSPAAERAAAVSRAMSEALAGRTAVEMTVPEWMKNPDAGTVAESSPAATPAVPAEELAVEEPSVTHAADVQEPPEIPEMPADWDERANGFIDDVGVRNDISIATEKLTGKAPSENELDGIVKNTKSKMAKIKAFGQPLKAFIAGAVIGGATKQVFRMGASIAGVGGLPAAMGIGAGGGAAVGIYREYMKQRRAGALETDTVATKEIRQKIKNEFARMKATDKAKIGKAALRGAIFGAASATAGGAIVEFAHHVDLSNIVHHIPVVGGHEAGATVVHNAGTPTPTGEATAIPTPEHDVTQAIAPSSPTPEGIPGVGGVENLVKPALPEGIDLPAGSNPWGAVKDQLTQALGKDPTDDQLREGVARFITGNNIADATKIAAGTHLDMTGVNHFAESILGSHQLIPTEIGVMPDQLPLPAGSDPWVEVSSYLKDLGKTPTSLQIMDITKELCRQSKIAVPEWGIPDGTNHNNLFAGFMLNFDDEVKRKIAAIAS